jgi:MFS family permease
VVETAVDSPELRTTTAGVGPGLTVPQWVLLGEATLPLFVMLTLNFFRPDLMSDFLNDATGHRVVGAVLLAVTLHVAVAGFFFARINRRFPPRTEGRRWRLVLVAAAGLFLLNLPATFAVLFGPIAVALARMK